jgi:hypothetical protein
MAASLDTKLTQNQQQGIEISKELFRTLPKQSLPNNIDIFNDEDLIKFVSKEIHIDKQDLKILRYQKYIIIHYENTKYIKENPEWSLKKYGEAMVIHIKKLKYCKYRFSQT